MCEIQLIHKFDEKILSNIEKENFFNLMRLGGERNDDAWGVFEPTTKTLIKSKGKFTAKKLDKIMKIPTTTIFGHNRWTTKGSEKVNDNNHPFQTEHFVVCHNGCLSNDEALKNQFKLSYDVETDSYIIIALLEHFYRRIKNNKNITKVIKKTAELLQGSYSVVVYFIPDKRLFYFKNYNTDFSFGLVKSSTGDLFIATTGKKIFTYIFNKTIRGEFLIKENEIYSFEPDEEMIYEIDNEEIFATLEFKEATKVNVSSWNGSKWNSTIKDYSAKKGDKMTYVSYDGYDDDKEYQSQIVEDIVENDATALIKEDYLMYAKKQLGSKIPDILQYFMGVWGIKLQAKLFTERTGHEGEYDAVLSLTCDGEQVSKAKNNLSLIEVGKQLTRMEFVDRIRTAIESRFNDITTMIEYTDNAFKMSVWWCPKENPPYQSG